MTTPVRTHQQRQWCVPRLSPLQILILLAVLSCLSPKLVRGQDVTRQQQQEEKEAQKEACTSTKEEDLITTEDKQEISSSEQDPAENEEATPKPEPHFSGLQQDAFGVWALQSYESFAPVLKRNPKDRPHGLLLALLYTSSASCPANQSAWLRKLEQAAEYVHGVLPGEDGIQFGTLDTSQWEGSAEWLLGIGVETTPTLAFIVARNFPANHQPPPSTHAFLLDYIGPLETAEDIGNTALQYYSRLLVFSTTPTNYRPFPNLPDDFAAQVVPRPFAHFRDVQAFWNQLGSLPSTIAASVHNRPGGVSEKWTPSDRDFIHWLMTGAEGKSDNKPYISLFVQCQAGPSSNYSAFATFAEMAWILSSRRDIWFVAVNEECHPVLSPGQVMAFRFYPHEDYQSSSEWVPAAVSHLTDIEQDLRRFLIHHSTPPVLWFDRYATAPIAFADDYKIHFLLLVNLHPLDNELPRYSRELQRIVRDFHNHCTAIKQNRYPNDTHAICLIVPSTETRILTTFGIDFWSPLDEHVHSDAPEKPPPTFPTLLITNRQPKEHRYRDGSSVTTHAVLRYILKPQDIFADNAVTRFLDDFWSNRLVPELRSVPWQNGDVRVNKFGVTTLNALEFEQRFQTMATTQEHALVLFTQPSCGHCKRFHGIYNEASKIIRDVHWDEYMALYKVEISQSNELHGIPLPWLPDVYYFPPNPATDGDPSASLPIAPIRYDVTDEFGNGVGRLSDPLELVEWWLEVMVGGAVSWMDPDRLLDILDGKEE